LAQAAHYPNGRAEAVGELAFHAFVKLQFNEAERLYKRIYTETGNEQELLIADIGLMKIYQRQALYPKYYEYRNKAVKRLRRLDEERADFIDPHAIARLNYAHTDFLLTSAVYTYYLRQTSEAVFFLSQIQPEELQNDEAQWLYYHYLRGACELYEDPDGTSLLLRSFDDLMLCLQQAQSNNYIYFEANALQGMAELLIDSADATYLENRRPYALESLGYPTDSLFALQLARQALGLFKEYGDDYQTAATYTTIGKYFNRHGRYSEARDSIYKALAYVTPERNLPEWIASIHAELSISYAGMGEKQKSDEHRNAYLDILQYTRQDREAENRYLVLRAEARQLNWILTFITLSIVLVIGFFWSFNRWSKRRNRTQTERLRLILAICRKVTASIPPYAVSEQEIRRAIHEAIGEDWKQLGQDTCLQSVIQPYIDWTINHGNAFIRLDNEQKTLEEQRYVYERHIARNKRENIVKKTCLSIVSGMVPYIDRILHEIRKLRRTDNSIENDYRSKYQYIDELVTAINEYNEILTLWIQMKQEGAWKLNVENFALNELFELLGKGRKAFEMHKQTLIVEPTAAIVKADKALTMFMINTLAENARKYTPDGGTIRIAATMTEQYVEISVADNGRGLSPEDVALIESEKIYDSRQIGAQDNDAESLRLRKGSGFGLINCKGIIDKYRKSGKLFEVCLFGVQSERDKGSRFFFRLPVGLQKAATCVLLFILSCTLHAESSLQALKDSIYHSNVSGNYTAALQYADSALQILNREYTAAKGTGALLSLQNTGEPAELIWWHEGFQTSYDLILFLRNEVAISCLALKRWDEYNYNNTVYEQLFKLYSEDRSWETYNIELEHSTRNKKIALLFVGLLFIALPIGYYFLYMRPRLRSRRQLEQVLDVNAIIFDASGASPSEQQTEVLQREPYSMQFVPQRIVTDIFGSINEWIETDAIGIAVYDEVGKTLNFASNPPDKPVPEVVHRCFECRQSIQEDEHQAFPLLVDIGETTSCIGVFYLHRRGTVQETDRLLLELVARHMGIVLFNSVIKPATHYRSIASAYDDTHRASWEDNQLHVQNLVLDNCLSAIKHETVYYPNKLKQIVEQLSAGKYAATDERQAIYSMFELMEYYKGVFTLLHACASRQLEDVTFRRATIPVEDLLSDAERYLERIHKTKAKDIQLTVNYPPPTTLRVVGDRILLQYLLENLINDAVSVPDHGRLEINVGEEEHFVRFRFTDHRRSLSAAEANDLFMPSLQRMKGTGEQLRGTAFLICKQIIREHDEYVGWRGCRIFAESSEQTGFNVVFTIPKRERKITNGDNKISNLEN
jgi:signal transduction histidine kinase